MSFGIAVVLTDMEKYSLIENRPRGRTESHPVTRALDDIESDFAELMKRHQRELHVHCYRMLGSFDEAEDLVQEVFLRAWRGREGFTGRSSVRSWLYRIATNACLDVLRQRSRHVRWVPEGETPPVSEISWLQPYPDSLLEVTAPEDGEPDTAVVAKETIELAFLAAIQLLPAKPRAVFILRDVLGWSAAETAAALDSTVPAVTSALQRARGTLQRHWPGGRSEWAPVAEPSEQELLLLERYIEAHERADCETVVELLHEDVCMSIPHVGRWRGRESVAQTLRKSMGSQGLWRMLPTRANGRPAAACYLRRWDDVDYRAFAITLLHVQDGAIKEITGFECAGLFAAFDLPPVI